MTKKLERALVEQKTITEPANPQIAGWLGIPLGGQKRVEVPGRNSYVYVRLRSNQSEVIQAYNNKVAASYNLPVLVERDGNRYVVASVDTKRYDNNWNSQSPFLPIHGHTHSFDVEGGGGGDPVWVQSRQFVPLLSLPSGSVGAGGVVIDSYMLGNSDGSWKYVGGTGSPNISMHRPSSPTGAIMALVYLDAPTGNPQIIVGSGTVFPNTVTGSSQLVPYIPSLPNPSTQIPLAAVRLISGTNQLSWDNIYDVRQWLHVTPSGSAGGLSSIAVQDEGVPQGNATTFNFVGSGVQASISGSVAQINVSGGGGTINTGVLDQRYLRLNLSNDPASGTFNIAPGNDTGLIVVQLITGSSAAPAIIVTRTAVNPATLASFDDYAFEILDTHPIATYRGGLLRHDDSSGRRLIDINPYSPSGTVTINSHQLITGSNPLLVVKNFDTEKFRIGSDGSPNIPTGSTYNIGGIPHAHDGWAVYNAVIPTLTASDDPTYTLQFAGVNLTVFLEEGTPLKWTQNSIVRYGFINSASSYSGGNTTITVLTRLDGSSANYDVLDTSTYPISNFCYGVVKQPGFGFPCGETLWTYEFADTSDRFQTNPTQNVWYNPGSVSFVKPLGEFIFEYFAQMYASMAGVNAVAFASMSTSNNSESDSDLTRFVVVAYSASVGTMFAYAPVNMRKVLSGAKATYYAITKTNQVGQANLGYNNSSGKFIARFRCAYL